MRNTSKDMYKKRMPKSTSSLYHSMERISLLQRRRLMWLRIRLTSSSLPANKMKLLLILRTMKINLKLFVSVSMLLLPVKTRDQNYLGVVEESKYQMWEYQIWLVRKNVFY